MNRNRSAWLPFLVRVRGGGYYGFKELLCARFWEILKDRQLSHLSRMTRQRCIAVGLEPAASVAKVRSKALTLVRYVFTSWSPQRWLGMRRKFRFA